MNTHRSPFSPVRPTVNVRIAVPGALALCLASGAALAADPSDDDIAAAIGDRTYQGSMTADAFAEYYAGDGTVRGDGYAGEWRVEHGALCLRYGDAAEEDCWKVEINGPAMTLLKDGEVDGSGMLIDGNPRGF